MNSDIAAEELRKGAKWRQRRVSVAVEDTMQNPHAMRGGIVGQRRFTQRGL